MDWLEFLISPYKTYSYIQIIMELIAAFSGVLSVIYAIRKNILVYPIGILSTGLYTFLLLQWALYGEMTINAYYTIMSLYGWIQWRRIRSIPAENERAKNHVSWAHIVFFLVVSFSAVLVIYRFKYSSIALIPRLNYIDALATSFFLVAMYLMAKMRIENWYFWIAGNLISIPLFAMKGYGITSLQYVIFLFLAIQGWRKWTRGD